MNIKHDTALVCLEMRVGVTQVWAYEGVALGGHTWVCKEIRTTVGENS